MSPSSEPVALYGPEYKRNPYPLYAELRERGPVHRVRFPSGVCAWLVTGYDAAHQALTDPRLGKHHSRGNAAWRARASIMPEPQHSQLQVHLLHQDPPRHTALRRLITDAFAPQRVESLRPRFQGMADALLDGLPDSGGTDLVEVFAARFPFQVLAEVIGLPEEFADRFDRDWGKVVQPVGPEDPGRPAYEARLRGLQQYIADLVRHKRAECGEDLLSRLVAARDAERLGKEELDSMVFQLLVAGQEPVTNQITTALVTLLRHPARLAELAARPELLPRAVEELLRHDSAFELTTWRFFAEDTELHGTRIPAGDSVIVSLSAANRDSRRFPDADALHFDRTPNPHLAFGHGIHFCPGATLARIELQIALGTLLRRLPDLRLAVPEDELEWTPAVLARGVGRLPVSYGRCPYAGSGVNGPDAAC
ncbi:cytochrome P450 [Streptomyces sp. Je 1-4]|uniref:cytochrome P450 family protein n=1 Tax=Streptomyces TaxID=1883 RepID=UPI00140EAB7B|nr:MULTISPECIES: cytochrome P450 [unclassified Streptomyces]QIK10323.1 cytochrome P450 [Streptomyces sp. ID38640]UYB44101.1 cytochrome P450 [Streptomyces sp. Je 1-4]UZQ40539.1 cytochrome P450 [Streptomyces sp. Je 1-4] [Streptomyces sp. Je 1-4 4N24]UZQ47956.1 cytochrome P450 [Streptomyces sp. Je 1-4] [Streptomyces sp. Je 1-4 4N24_ara]